jgi:Xaa-Pro aminopeptidase
MLLGWIDILKTESFPTDQAYIFNVDLKRDQLETRVATLELMLVTARARPTLNENEIAKLEQELKIAKAALEEYEREHPGN